jgi:signal peptide peptidase SppA
VKYPHVAARIFNTPLLIHPQKLDAIIAGLGQRLLALQVSLRLDGADAIAPADMLAPELFSTRRGERVKAAGWPGYQVVDGVAVVTASGALVHRTKIDANSDLLLGYNDLAAAVEHAADNTDVHAILQVWDSPGGEVQGAFEFAQRMADMRKKPLHAIADGMAASAAYLGGSASGKPAITATGYAGSIGVVMRHVDFSGALAKDGIKVDFIFAGAHKVDGNPFEKLPAAVRADFQAEINSIYDMFVAAVERQTGISADAIRATEARTYMGQAAVDAGLASRVTTTDALITELAGLRARSYPAGPSGKSSTTKGTSMAGNNAAADGQSATFAQADLDKARAEGHAQGIKEGTEQGAKAERDRVSGILAHKDAAGKTELAVTCITSGLSVEQSGAILAAAPAPVEAVHGNAFAAAMGATGNPNVQGIEGKDVDLESQQAVASSWDKAFGVKQARH